MTEIINTCRICKNTNLLSVFSLGNQSYSGIFVNNEYIPDGELNLVRCTGEDACNLVQLDRDFDQSIMYGNGYGYRSGLNKMMINHLKNLASITELFTERMKNQSLVILDIGSNDGTLLKHFKNIYGSKSERYGIDPSSKMFSEYYDADVKKSDKFFSKSIFNEMASNKKANIITSIAMFYDLPDPLQIVMDISDVLADDGIWIVEQSYLPLMIATNSFDTICHEHTEYYTLRQFDWMCKIAGLNIVDVSMNNSNGGSFRLVIKKNTSRSLHNMVNVQQFRDIETFAGINSSDVFDKFAKNIQLQKKKLLDFMEECKINGKSICGLGASTKGNTLLQFYNLTSADIPVIGEVNPQKYGKQTPGTSIAIVNEKEILDKYDYFVVLPWHFKDDFCKNSTYANKKLVFPLPIFDIVEINSSLND